MSEILPICDTHDVYKRLSNLGFPHYKYECPLCHKEFLKQLDEEYRTRCAGCFESICDMHEETAMGGGLCECTDPMHMHWHAIANHDGIWPDQDTLESNPSAAL